MSKQIPVKLQHTTNYELFEVSPFNRDLHSTNVLLISMKKHGFIPAYPIHCIRSESGKLVIKAGHHRFETARKLGIGVYYIVCDDGSSIAELEKATSKWTIQDFLISHVRAGSAPHIAIKEYVDRTGINIMQAASLFAGESASSMNYTARLKDGTFEVKDTKRAEAIGSVILKLKSVGIDFATKKNLVAAICSFMWLEQFNADVFVHRVANNLSMFHRCSTMLQYQEMIDRIYNYGAKQKIALCFLAREHARKRTPIQKKQA